MAVTPCPFIGLRIGGMTYPTVTVCPSFGIFLIFLNTCKEICFHITCVVSASFPESGAHIIAVVCNPVIVNLLNCSDYVGILGSSVCNLC